MGEPYHVKGTPMKVPMIGLGVSGGFAAVVAGGLLLIAFGACGKSNESWSDAGPGGGYYVTEADGNVVYVKPGTANPNDEGGLGLGLPGASTPDAGGDSTIVGAGPPMAIGTVTDQDCPGCRFPTTSAGACKNAPPITILYPADTVILPPNLNEISIHWTPYGAGYQRFSVDFSAPPNTDWHILTSCANQTNDEQVGPGASPSGGCELLVDPVSWSKLVGVNRDLGPVTVTVSGTTDGRCVSTSNPITINFAKEDLLGTYFYWKSFVTQGQGVGGQIWMKDFGDLNMQERDVTSNVTATGGATLAATCNGCHALSRDGSRMVVYSDDNDSDDEYTDVSGSLLDMTGLPSAPAKQLGTGANPDRNAQGGQPPGFSAINPPASFYVSSNGFPLLDAGIPPAGVAGGTSTSNGYPSAVAANQFSVWDGMGNFTGPVNTGCNASRPTMPDWSIDGKTVIFVSPASVYNWALWLGGSNANDDDHISGGSFCTMPYMGNGTFGAASMFFQSNGENNYYPSYSPDSDPIPPGDAGVKPPAFILFNRVPAKGGAGTNCNGAFCQNDSFSNPDARLWLMPNQMGGTPIDLEKANGSSASSPVSLSNSYPRWAPFVQVYHGNRILWFTFSSTRDYGLRVLNHKSGMYQCYPPDSPEVPAGAHRSTFDPACQQPQIWMAPILFHEGGSLTADPSGVAFWVPYQDIDQHNHTAQWTWKPNPPPPPLPDGAPPPCSCSHVYEPCGAANACGCCPDDKTIKCGGSGKCIPIIN
jgi:hypothetical protein